MQTVHDAIINRVFNPAGVGVGDGFGHSEDGDHKSPQGVVTPIKLFSHRTTLFAEGNQLVGGVVYQGLTS